MKVGIYNFHMRILGGGEKEMCVIAETLSRKHDTDLIMPTPVSQGEMENRFNVDMGRVTIRTLSDKNPPPLDFSGWKFKRRVFENLMAGHTLSNLTKKYDVFIANNIPILSYAKRNVLMVYFPYDPSEQRKELRLQYGTFNVKVYYLLRSLLSPERLECYDIVLADSRFTQGWIKRYWGIDSKVLYPPVEMFKACEKKNVILSVGRIQKGGNDKKFIPMIKTYKRIYEEGFREWEFHLAGPTYPEAEHREYLEEIIEEAEGYPIFVHNDITYKELARLYGEGKIYWHAAGFGEDAEKHPARFEHFGITTAEAMSAGCVPVTFNGGGQPEIVEHGKSGFLWNDTEELKEYTKRLMSNKEEREKMGYEAQVRADVFGRKKFEEEVTRLVD